MRITFISQARFPTEKAHGHQIAQVCAAMSKLGHAVTLVAPDVASTVHKDPQEYYGLSEPLRVVRLPTFDAHRAWWVPGVLAFFFTMRSYARSLRKWLTDHPAHLLYTRSPRLVPVLLETGTPVVLELHTLPQRSRTFTADCNRCSAVVCLTRPMKEELLSWGVEPRRVMVEGDGVEPSRFVSLPSQLEARTQWRLPSDRRIIVYVGSLVTRGVIEKGVRELLTATALLRADGEPILLWVIGGPRERVGEYQHLAAEVGLLSEDIRFEGPVHSRRVPSALAAADVCVYPAPASAHPFFLRDTSPLKIFEYLAAGRPTVCAALPPLEGVIDPSLVHFCAPGNPQALAAAIREAVRKPRTNEGARRALMERISWNARMGRILETVDK